MQGDVGDASAYFSRLSAPKKSVPQLCRLIAYADLLRTKREGLWQELVLYMDGQGLSPIRA